MTTGSQDALRMRIEFARSSLSEPSWPEGITVRTFSPVDARAVHALLEDGYRYGGGSVASFETWLPQTTTDAEFDPALLFLAESDAALAGVALCWTSAFVKDLVVRASWRRRGVGEALLRHVFGVFADRGAPAVELKVQAANAGAIRLYKRCGMRAVQRVS